MPWKTAITRAARAMREDARLYIVAVSSLTVAFLCLAASLLALTNLATIAEAWGQSGRMSIYLRDGARGEDVEQLRMLLDGLPEVREVRHLDAAAARDEFLRDAEVDPSLAQLPVEVFPASLEVELRGGVASARVRAISDRVQQFGAVEAVESYQGWFARLESLLGTGRLVSSILALLVGLCVLFVVGNTIRLAVAGRRDEIEVLKLCGASDGFVRGPFLVEGAAQGFVAALASVVLLLAGFALLRDQLDATLAGLAGVRTAFLSPLWAMAMVLGGALVGATGSALSLRRYLGV